MATRYYVSPDHTAIYVSEKPEEHKAIQAMGFTALRAWDAVKYDSYYASKGLRNGILPEGMTVEQMRQVTESGKAGNFGMYEVRSAFRLEYTGDRAVKVGRGQYDFVQAES